MADVDVKTKLTLDDAASAVLGKIKGGYKDVAKAAKDARGEALDFAKSVAATALGTALSGMIRGAKEMAKEWALTANAAYDQQQAIAGTLAVMQGLEWGEARKEAELLHRELREMAIDVGHDFGDVQRGFDVLLVSLGASEKAMAANQTYIKQMTVTANVMGMSVEQVAMEFSKVSQGFASAESKFVLLLAKTGIFGDDMKTGVEEFNKLDPQKRAELAASGLAKLGAELGKATPTVTDLATSLGGMFDLFKETMGGPVIRALIPAMKNIRAELAAASPQIEAWAEAIGDDLAQAVTDGARYLKEGFQYIRTHSQEIRASIVEAATGIKDAFVFAKDVVSWILDHKGELAAIWGTAKLGGAMQAAGGIAEIGAMEIGGSEVVAGVAGGKAVVAGAGASIAAAGAAAAALAAFAGAISGVALAGHQAYKLYQETFGSMSEEALNAAAQLKAAGKMIEQGELPRARELAEQAAAASEKGHEMAAKTLQVIKERETAILAIEQQISAATQALQIAPLVDAYNKAVAMGNVELQEMAATTIMSSDKLEDALIAGRHKITGGMDSLTKAAYASFEEWEKAMDDMVATIGAGQAALRDVISAIPGADPSISRKLAAAARTRAKSERGRARAAGGGTAINVDKLVINQEFRDQDPDRIVTAFKRDIVRHATRRTQARRGTIFGFG